ncbi:MAG: biotin--[acetyl-CoA-carboxylase] ligase [Clostridia bacterium]|nr:biotin--[acetyl-CoA-carboxylase] ligase [Clostridia bacterium]
MSVKQELLSLFVSGKCLSGEEIAGKLGVTRAAVWKGVQALIAEGYPIESTPGTGYRLAENDLLFAEKLKPLLPPEIQNVFCFSETDSTNRQAKLYAEEHPGACALFVADSQTAGRGRRGHTFDSAAGVGIYMSLLLCPTLPPERAIRLTTSAAVAVCKTVEKLTGAKTQIKWVNDVYLNGKKAVGILTEGAFDLETGAFRYAVIGIGINVKDREFPAEIAATATSIEKETGIAPNRAELIAGIVRELTETPPDSPSLTEEYRKRMFLIGKRVNVLSPAGTYSATVLGVGENCELTVRDEGGNVLFLSSGDVSIRPGKS